MAQDHLGADFAELGLDPSADFGDVKAAFRRAALRFHPDRGGDARRFIRAYAAYRRLCEHFRGPAQEDDYARDGAIGAPGDPIDELVEHLEDLGAAFEAIRQDLMEAEGQWVADIRADVMQALNSASHCSEVDAIMKNTIKCVTRKFAKEVTQIVGSSVGAIGEAFNTWMLSWLTPYYDSIRDQHAKLWWRSRTAVLVASICGLLMAWLGAASAGLFWGAVGGLAGVLGGWALSCPLHLVIGAARYRAEGNVPVVRAPSVYVDKSHMQIVTDAVTDEQLGMAGAVGGLYAFGPWGALAGLVLGGIAGAVFGQDVAERRRIAVEQLDAFLPRACRQIRTLLVEQLNGVAVQMREEAKHNYRTARHRAAACVHLLPEPR